MLQAVEDQEVAVLLCDLDGLRGAGDMLKLLKQLHPRVQAIALSSQADSTELVRLINQAQLFRFLLAPVRPGFLEHSIRSALNVHANQKARPELVQRQQVQAAPEAAASSVGQQILKRLTMFVRGRAAVA